MTVSRPISGLFNAADIADMTAAVEAICAEVQHRGLLVDMSPNEIRPWISEFVVDLQSARRLAPSDLKAAVLASITARVSFDGVSAK